MEDRVFVVNEPDLGSLKWMQSMTLEESARAFAQIHAGECTAPKVVLMP